MKTITTIAYLLFLLAATRTEAELTIPGADGSDGDLIITTNTVIDLSQAVTANWDADNTANPGGGVYDSNQWAVVFKYSSVNIAAGATVTFKNHLSRAPVVWLVSGNVTINGSVILDGQVGVLPPYLSEPGPGGFRGGAGWYSVGVANAPGFGPGGGLVNIFNDNRYGGGGSYGSVGYYGPSVYGNPSLVPLIGGSGGSGCSASGLFGACGGAGGGAIAIFCSGILNNSGLISANGGNSLAPSGGQSGGGSGGGIRIVSQTLAGNGVIQALGGGLTSIGGYPGQIPFGGLGRIRLERVVNTNSISVTPDPSVVDLPPNSTALIWPPNNAPGINIVSIGTTNAPTDPRAGFGTIGADIVQPLTNSIPVVIETTNVEQASQVLVLGTPRSNGTSTTVNASVSSIVNTSPLTILWTANLPVNVGYSAVQVQVVRP